jgi:hypothetical protein
LNRLKILTPEKSQQLVTGLREQVSLNYHTRRGFSTILGGRNRSESGRQQNIRRNKTWEQAAFLQPASNRHGSELTAIIPRSVSRLYQAISSDLLGRADR